MRDLIAAGRKIAEVAEDLGISDQGVGLPTVASAYRFLRAVLYTAVDDGLIRRNPCRIEGADKEHSPERPGELVALRRRHIDLENGSVEVKVKLAEVQGQFETGLPKSAAGVRLVSIPEASIPDLRAHLEAWSQPGATGLVFVGPRGKKTPRRTNFSRYWQAALTASGVEVDPELGLHLHDLRHTGNQLRSPGASLREMMSHMGHSTSKAALIYQHASWEREREMGQRLSEAIEAAGVWHVDGTDADGAIAKVVPLHRVDPA